MEDNKKMVAIIKLGFWLAFIIVLVIIVKFGNNSNKDNEKRLVDINDIGNNYKYKYEIKVNDNIYNYVGSKKDNKESGYLLTNNNYLYYYKENENTYSVLDGNLTLINNLYNGINVDLINVEHIKSIINNINSYKNNNIITYNVLGYQIDIIGSRDKLNINILYDNIEYRLEFSDINKVKEITY